MIDPIEWLDLNSNLYETETYNQKFSDYKLIYCDCKKSSHECINKKELFIIGIYPSEATEKSYMLHFDNLEILISLLKLGKIVYPSFEVYDHNRNEFQSLYSEEIIAWCKKFGLPYIDNNLNYKSATGNEEESSMGFNLYEFKAQLYFLYQTFNLWYGLININIEMIKKFDPYYFQNKSYTKEEIIEIKEDLSNNMGPFLTKFMPKYNSISDTFETIPYSDDILSVAYFQLTLLMMNKGDKSIDFCVICGNLYIKNHGNYKYCSNCQSYQNSNRVHNLRKRKEEKARDYIIIKYNNSNKSAYEIFNLEKDYIEENFGKSTPFNKMKIKKWINNK